MVYDLTMLEAFYSAYKGKVEHVRAVLKRPLTLAEKILYAHLFNEGDVKNYKRGEDYVNFRPDRVAMQDATAQMALLQFMNAGKEKVAVPSTVHCDHLIQAYKGAKEDIATATKTNEEVYDFLRDVSSRYGIGFHHRIFRTGNGFPVGYRQSDHLQYGCGSRSYHFAFPVRRAHGYLSESHWQRSYRGTGGSRGL